MLKEVLLWVKCIQIHIRSSLHFHMEEGTPSTPKTLQTSPVEKHLEETPASILAGHKKIADFLEHNSEHQPGKSKSRENLPTTKDLPQMQLTSAT